MNEITNQATSATVQIPPEAIALDRVLATENPQVRAPHGLGEQSRVPAAGAPDLRPRAYPLTRFAKERRLATLEGRLLPANERRARAPEPRANQSDRFEQHGIPVFKYLKKKFLRCPALERTRFALTLEVAARSCCARAQNLEPAESRALDPGPQDQGEPVAATQSRLWLGGNRPGRLRAANRGRSRDTVGGQAATLHSAGSSAGGGSERAGHRPGSNPHRQLLRRGRRNRLKEGNFDPRHLRVESTLSKEQKLKIDPQTRAGRAQERFAPRRKTGPTAPALRCSWSRIEHEASPPSGMVSPPAESLKPGSSRPTQGQCPPWWTVARTCLPLQGASTNSVPGPAGRWKMKFAKRSQITGSRRLGSYDPIGIVDDCCCPASVLIAWRAIGRSQRPSSGLLRRQVEVDRRFGSD